MSNFKENVGTQNVVTKWSKAMDSSNHGCSDFMGSSFTVSLCKKKWRHIIKMTAPYPFSWVTCFCFHCFNFQLYLKNYAIYVMLCYVYMYVYYIYFSAIFSSLILALQCPVNLLELWWPLSWQSHFQSSQSNSLTRLSPSDFHTNAIPMTSARYLEAPRAIVCRVEIKVHPTRI